MSNLLDKILQKLKEEREKEKKWQEEERKAYESFMHKAQSSEKSANSSKGAIATIKAEKDAQDKETKDEWNLYSKYIPRPQKAELREKARETNNTVKRENAYKNIQNSDLFESWTKKAKALGLSGQSAFDWASEQYNKDPMKQTLVKRTTAFELAHPEIENKYGNKSDLVKYALYAGEKIKEGLDKGRQEQKKAEEEEKSAYNQYVPANHNDDTLKKESIYDKYLSPDSLDVYNPANDFYYGGDYKTDRSKIIQEDLNARDEKLTDLINTDLSKEEGYEKNTTLNGAPDFLDKHYNNPLYIDYNVTNSETEAYTKLTQNEIDNYNFVKNKFGKDSQITKDYADHLIYLGSGRYEKEKAETIKSPKTKIGSVLFGYVTGGNYYSQGLHAVINKAENNISPVADNSYQQKYEAEMNDANSKMNKFLSSIGYSAGYMSIPAVIAALTKNPQSYYASFGVSIWGNSFNESRQENKSIEQSAMYATINTTIELCTQKLLEKTVGTFIPHTAKNSMLYKNLSEKMADRPVLSVLMQSFARSQGEGIEEGLQTLFDPIVRNTVFGERHKFGENWREALYSYTTGVVTSFILGSHADAVGLKDVYIAKKFNLKENFGDFMSSLYSDGVYMTNSLKDKFIQIGKEMTDEELYKSVEEINKIGEVEIGGVKLSDISKFTKSKSSAEVIDFLYDITQTDKFKEEFDKIKARKEVNDSSEDGGFGGRGKEDANVEADSGKQDAFNENKALLSQEKNNIDVNNKLKKSDVNESINFNNNLITSKELDEGIEHYNKTLSFEPKITDFITKMASKLSMNIEGFEYRIKSKDSYLRKLNTANNKGEIRDIIRYTYSAKSEILTDKVIECIEEFNAKGYNTIKVKNTWIDELNPYKGINTIVKTPEGSFFELQYHTPESFALTNLELHKLYEKLRLLEDTTSEEYIKLQNQMLDISKDLIKPIGIERLINK